MKTKGVKPSLVEGRNDPSRTNARFDFADRIQIELLREGGIQTRFAGAACAAGEEQGTLAFHEDLDRRLRAAEAHRQFDRVGFVNRTR